MIHTKPLVENSDQTLIKYLSSLNRGFTSLESSRDLPDAFQRTYSIIREFIQTVTFYAGLYEAQSDRIDWLFQIDENPCPKKAINPDEEEVISLAMHRKETVYSSLSEQKIFSLTNDKRISLSENRILSKANLVSPIIIQDGVFGIISIRSHNQKLFAEQDAYLLSIIASHIGLSLQSSKLVEEQAQKEELQSIVELVSSVGHEFNQPLTGITGYCALIKEDLQESDTIYKDIERIEKQAGRLEKLIFKFQNLLQLENRSNDDDTEL